MKPRDNVPGLSCISLGQSRFWCAKPSIGEPIVQAAFDDVHGLLKGAAGSEVLVRRKGERDLVLAEVHVVVLDLGGPIICERVFEAAADRPAPSRLRCGPAVVGEWIVWKLRIVKARRVLPAHPSGASLGVEQ